MKKAVIAMLSLLLVLSAAPAYAATFMGEENFSSSSNVVVEDDVYIGASNATLAGQVVGDVFAFAGNLFYNGIIDEDFFTAGGSVYVLGDVGDDLRAAGGNIIVEGVIGDDVLAAGGVIQLVDGTAIGGDAVLAGGAIMLDATVEGMTTIYGDEIIINGTLKGDVSIESGTSVELGPNAVIEGNVTHRGYTEMMVDEAAVVNGEVSFEPYSAKSKHYKDRGSKGDFAGFLSVMVLFKMLIMLVTGVLFAVVAKRFTKLMVDQGMKKTGISIVTGFITLVVVPLAAILLFVTIFGSVFACLGLTVYFLFLMVGRVYAGIILGGFLAKLAKQKNVSDWKWALLGIFVLEVICLIPIIGWVIAFVFFLIGFGALLMLAYEKLWLKR